MYGTLDTSSEIVNGDLVSVLSDADPEPGFKGQNCLKSLSLKNIHIFFLKFDLK